MGRPHALVALSSPTCCLAYLLSSWAVVGLQAKVTDQVQVSFYTNATQYSAVPTGGLQGNGTGVGVAKTSQSCAQKCPKASDVTCLVANRCWSGIGKALGALVGAAAGGASE